MSRQLSRRRVPAWSVWLIILSWVLTACGPAATPAPAPTSQPAPQSTEPAPPPSEPSPTTAPAAAEPVVLKLGWLGKPDTLNPAYAFLTESYIVFDLILSPLVTEGIDGKYTGDLAAEWSSSPDGLLWTFKLRDNLKWHDGAPLTAEDVAWSINAVIQDPDGWAALSGYVGGFKEAIATDAKTVQIGLEAPIGNMEYRVSFLYALPRKDFESFTTPEDLQNFANDAAVGSGAFKLKSFDKDQGVIVLDANPDFHLGRPKIDQAIFRTFDNEDAMVQAIKVGDIDAVIEVPSTAAETVKGFANVKVVQQPSRSLSQLIVNSAPADHDPAPTRNPALEDPVVKLAIAHAIDKQDLVDIVLQGLGKPGYSIIPPTLGGGFWHNPNIQDVPFSLATANDLLEKAGYVKGSDGVRAKGDVKLEFRLQFPSDSDTAPRVADLMTGWFKEAGIRTTPQAVDPDALTSACCPAGDYDLILWGWGSDPDPDFMLSVMTSDQFVDGGWSDSGYTNPRYDELYLAQQSAIDSAERQKIVWEMQQMVFDDKPYIVYWYADTLQAYRTDRFQSFIESPILGLESAASLRQVEPVK
jgi:peptide/nickel transport system substrate-binding protein